jgi:hypothetical protein
MHHTTNHISHSGKGSICAQKSKKFIYLNLWKVGRPRVRWEECVWQDIRFFGCKELEECGIKWGRMAGNSEEGQGPQRAVAPMMMMMI